jgi:hypothetical protein
MLTVFIVLLSNTVAEGNVLRSSKQHFLDSPLHRNDAIFEHSWRRNPYAKGKDWEQSTDRRQGQQTRDGDEIIVEGENNRTNGAHIGSQERSAAGILSWTHGWEPPDFEKQYEQESYLHKYPLIHAIDSKLAYVFAKYTLVWWRDWKIWVGGFLWLVVLIKWIYSGYEENYIQRFAFAAGINLVILHHLQYAANIQVGISTVCLLLTGQCLLQNGIWFCSGSQYKEKVFLCDTMYLDLTLPSIQIACLFVAQFIIWWFYMTSILGTFDFTHVNYAFWVSAFIVMQMTMIFNRGSDSVLGNPFPILDVYHLIVNCDRVALRLLEADSGIVRDSDGDELCHRQSQKKLQNFTHFHVSRVSLIMRGVFGFFSNAILREIMSYTIPLMLMCFSEPMDFVVYCLGVNFICTIDDMGDKTFEIIPLDQLGDHNHTSESEGARSNETATTLLGSRRTTGIARSNSRLHR